MQRLLTVRDEGTFMLDMVDTDTHQMVSRGIAEGVLEDNQTAKKLDKDGTIW